MNEKATNESVAGPVNLIWPALLFCLLTPLIMHLMFSWMGFNAGNHGMLLAGSRRLLQGQMPWRDFLAWHSPLPYLLHIPLTMFGGDRIFWWARLVLWFQLTVAAWCSADLVCRGWALNPRRLIQPMLAFAALMVSAHNFALDLHPSVDAWFFASIGMCLVYRGYGGRKMAGCLALGLAAVCKPGFLPVGIVALLALSDRQRLKQWLLFLLPPLVFVVWLVFAGLLPLAFECMMVGEPWSRGMNWLRARHSGFILAGYLGLRFLFHEPPLYWSRRLLYRGGWLLLGLWPVYITWRALAGGIFNVSATALFWIAIGMFVYLLLDARRRNPAAVRIMLPLILAAVAVNATLDYITPALTGGVLLLFSVAWLLAEVRLPVRVGLSVLLALLLFQGMNHGRNEHGFYEQPSVLLCRPLEHVLPGGKGIMVNTNVHAFLDDFKHARELAADTGYPLAVVPEIPAYWVSARQANFMPADSMVIPRDFTQDMTDMFTELALARGTNLTVLMQKTYALRLDRSIRRLPGRRNNQITRPLSRNMLKTNETTHFIIYVPR